MPQALEEAQPNTPIVNVAKTKNPMIKEEKSVNEFAHLIENNS